MNTIKPWPVPEGWQNTLNEWVQTMNARSLTPETVRTRLSHMRTVARAMDCPPDEVTARSLLGYVASKSWRPETRHSYHTSIRQFFGWFSAKNGSDNPAADIPIVSHAAGIPRPIPDDDLATAFAAANQKERLVLSLAAFAGLRAAEISRVNVNDLGTDDHGNLLIVYGKGQKERAIPITKELAESIRAQAEPGTGWVFPGDCNGHLSPRWISKLGARLLPGTWTLHTLRHRFGTRAYAGERDLLAVQRLLGHASVATTQRYVNPPSDAMRRAVESAQRIN